MGQVLLWACMLGRFFGSLTSSKSRADFLRCALLTSFAPRSGPVHSLPDLTCGSSDYTCEICPPTYLLWLWLALDRFNATGVSGAPPPNWNPISARSSVRGCTHTFALCVSSSVFVLLVSIVFEFLVDCVYAPSSFLVRICRQHRLGPRPRLAPDCSGRFDNQE